MTAKGDPHACKKPLTSVSYNAFGIAIQARFQPLDNPFDGLDPGVVSRFRLGPIERMNFPFCETLHVLKN